MLRLFILCVLVMGSFSFDVPVQCTDCTCSDPVVNCNKVCDVCECSNDTIDCSFRKLNASFSEEISKWPSNNASVTLMMEHNFIGRVVRYPAVNITTLSLRYNTIVEIDHRAFIDLARLEDLDLSYNVLSDLSAEVFEGPYSPVNLQPLNIASLNLSYNEFSDLDQNLFEHLPRLNRLMLNGNPLADETGKLRHNSIIAIAGSAPNLELLDLSETGLSSLPATFLKNLVKLKELVLIDNMFTALPADELSFSSSLQIINFNFNPIQVLSTQRKFPSLPTVTQLHISHMPKLKRIEDGALVGLSGLKYLACFNNQFLEYIAVGALSSSNLTKLELQDNSLHYLPEKLVARWDRLQTISLFGNRWSCDCDNQWMLKTLIPLLKDDAQGLMCSQPSAMQGASMQKLSERNYEMRCLDYYGNHPERDGSFLVVTFALVIIALVIIAAVLIFRRGRLRRGKAVDYTAIYEQSVRDDFGG